MNDEIDSETIGLVRKTILNRRGLVIDMAGLRAALQAADLVPRAELEKAKTKIDSYESALQKISDAVTDPGDEYFKGVADFALERHR